MTGEGLQGFILPTAQQILVNKLTHASLAAGLLHDDDARNFLNRRIASAGQAQIPTALSSCWQLTSSPM
ncbi:MAG: hypothetical protein ACLTGI_03730 [Hoylesella buccalis]